MSDAAFERQLASWQGKIAVAAKTGDGLDCYKTALSWAKNLSSDKASRELAKREILEAAERHLSQTHASILDFVYFSIFPEDATSNSDLDAEIEKHDKDAEITAEIERLAKLSVIQYGRERKQGAKKLGIGVATLDRAVKSARHKNDDTRGQGHPLELPEIKPWPDPVNGSELLDQIVVCLREYLILPSGSAEIIALWVLHTHVFDCFMITPRLAITSPEKGCGKTTLLDVINQLVDRPLPTSNATTSAVFRIIEMQAPTLLIDEADTFLKEQ
jgi:predicted DNA-binding protein (UPF0251 family)